jgi:hypothetical protein
MPRSVVRKQLEEVIDATLNVSTLRTSRIDRQLER